jgi:catechol-2,3-dioxygenase
LGIRQFDHVGITVADLDSVTAFFADLGLEVEDLQGAVDGLAANGYGLVGRISPYENTWRMARVRGPDGIVVSLTERID